MTKREKVLAGVVGFMGIAYFGSSLLTRYQGTVAENRAHLLETEQELSQARTARLRGERAVTRLRRWQQQSLPTNEDIANSLYQDWLQKQLTESGLKANDIKRVSGVRDPAGRFQEFTFNIEASGDSSALVKFLTSFYKAGHLHRISRASVSRVKEGTDLSVSFTVDALAMRDAPREDALSDAPSNVELPPGEEIDAAITQRKPFVPFEEKIAQVADKDSASEADQAFVSGMMQGADGWLMSVRMNDSGRMLYFQAGDEIEIGKFKGKVNEINGRRALLERDGSTLQVFLGQNLGQAQPYAPQAG